MSHVEDIEIPDLSKNTLSSSIQECHSPIASPSEEDDRCSRAEIDMSAPFESVMQAATRFGELGFWKPYLSKLPDPEQIVAGMNIRKADESATELEKELVMKEKEALEGSNLNEFSSSSPESISKDLELAKLELASTASDLTEIKASICSYNTMIEEERTSLDSTCERLFLNTIYIASFEEELKARNELNFEEVKRCKQMEEAARTEVLAAMSEIQQVKNRIKTAEIQLLAAKKVKEASKAAKDLSLAEINSRKTMEVRLEEAVEISRGRIVEAMNEVDEANISKAEILKKLEEAMKEVRSSRKTLEETLDREEAANIAKLAAEEALRRWRSDQGRRLNNSYLVDDSSTNSTLSIGEILRRKLLHEELQKGKRYVRRKVSLGKMLDRLDEGQSEKWSNLKRFPGRRSKFRLPRLLALMPRV